MAPNGSFGMTMVELVRSTYGEEAANAFEVSPTNDDMMAIHRIGREVLSMLRDLKAGRCTQLSAMMFARWERERRQNLYMFAGGLLADDVRIWGRDDMADTIQERILSSNQSLDLHCWLGIGEYILDISICRTARTVGAPAKLREVLLRVIPEPSEVLLLTASGLATSGLVYLPHAVLSAEQVYAHASGIAKLLDIQPPGA
jgi:hypothetical protein